MAGKPDSRDGGSFRDPSGFVFRRDGVIYRQVDRSYAAEYDALTGSGLYEELADAGLLIRHEEVALPPARPDQAHRILRPEPIGFISYPYEWCFSQLKDAALLHLRIQRCALRHGMTLKDCSAYNVQFVCGRPILIDTLSFERYREGRPWAAYRQFCQHFLAPLALMSYRDIRLGHLLRSHIDGIPLDLASCLLPQRTRLVMPLLLHLHLHARSQARHARGASSHPMPAAGFSLEAFWGLLDSLEAGVRRLTWRADTSRWAEYYSRLCGYAAEAADHKQQVVAECVEQVRPGSVWDLGANTGRYSRLASDRGIPTISFDMDPGCVELSYRTVRARGETALLPLVQDLTNPSPNLGWAGEERLSLASRGPVDLALGLALIHHLAIGNNLPLPHIAAFLSSICRALVLEFVPKEDPQVRTLLAGRRGVFEDYSLSTLKSALAPRFEVVREVPLQDSLRSILLLKLRE